MPKRHSQSWRYKVIKRYLHRAQTFQQLAETKEEREAWEKVERWFKSILEWKYLSKNGTLRLPAINLAVLETNIERTGRELEAAVK